MVTYPSTHGVFEEAIREICALVHDHRRPGVRRRRQPERARRPGPAREVRRRRQPPQPAQDVLHPPRRRRAGRRPGGGAGAPRPVPARRPVGRASLDAAGRPAVAGAPFGSASILPISWMYIRLMGARRAARRDRPPRSSAPTTSPAGSRMPSRRCTAATTVSSPTSASSTCARSPRRPTSPSTTSPSG